MGMFDIIEVEYPLPVDIGIADFQTKDFDCTMSTYKITSEGRLLGEKWHYEEVPEEQRPNYGKPEWDTPLGTLFGSMKKVIDEVYDLNFHGWVNFYTFKNDKYYEFYAKFTDGKLQVIDIDNGRFND